MVRAVAPNEFYCMKLRFKVLIFCLLNFTFWGISQQRETIVFTKKLQWNDETVVNTADSDELMFEESVPAEGFGQLPSIVHREALKSYGRIISVEIRANSTAPARKAIDNNALRYITNEWQHDVSISTGRGKPYLIVQIIPIRQSGRIIEKIIDCEITITWEHSSKPNLKSIDFAEQSVLKEGNWYKIAIARDGVYKIDKNTFNQLGVNINSLNPQNINIYGNGGQLLPANNSVPRYDDLQKCAIYIQGEEDNVFQENDYILFYGKGPDTWTRAYNEDDKITHWVHEKHFYSDSAYYFIRTDDTEPLRIETTQTIDESTTHTVRSFQDFQFIESDLYNISRSGREFYGELFDVNTTGSFTFNFPDIRTDKTALLEAAVVVRSIGGSSNWTVTVGGISDDTPLSTTGNGVISAFGSAQFVAIPFTPSGASTTVNLQFNKYSPTAEVLGWLDFLRLNVTRNLQMNGAQMKFRDTLSVGLNNVGLFQLGNANSVSQIWDVTDFIHPRKMVTSTSGSTIEFKAYTSELREYIAFANSGFLSPSPIGAVPNQNLHSLSNIDYIIVAAPSHRASAEALAAIHENLGTSTLVVSQQEIFNEFSSGNPDVTAIRMLMKMFYDRADGNEDLMPKNLLLFGDGSYNQNRGLASFNGTNVMLYETTESLRPLYSSVSDDYYVMLDDDDDESSLKFLDAGVGRIPASEYSEGAAYVEKVRAYLAQNSTSSGGASCLGDETQSPFGAWRNLVVFVADDQDGNGGANEAFHLNDADELADSMNSLYPEFDISKIYLDSYKQESTPGGERYPEAEEAIRNRVQNGCLLVTYLGHGGERGWSHERILDLNTISSWSNKNRLPVFLTATCELARFDDPAVNTAGELLVMNPDGGGIAMLTTTRVVFAGANMAMNRAFYKIAFEEDSIKNLTLGRINMLTKNGVSPSNSSKPNFSLLGDPALKMAYPKYRVVTTAVNDSLISESIQTLKALQEVKMSGHLEDESGNKLTNFNGFIYPTVYDKQSNIYTLNNDYDGTLGDIQEFKSYNKIIFKGKASVINGDFSFQFVVPYDINYVVDNARVSYYSVSGSIDGHGQCDQFRIGGSLSGAELNRVGPEISLYLNDTLFISGGLSDTKPILIGKLKDENGINTVGNGIGHDLIAIIDNNTQQPIILNEFYETDLDTYKSGEIRYQLPELSEGNHTLKLQAWDVHNNSSSATIDFIVAKDSEIALEHVLNYPNPFTSRTEFMFEHNQVCNTLDVLIQIFTVSGKLVKTIEHRALQHGFRSESIPWDGTDDFGDRIGKGVYVYRMEVRNENGQSAEQIEKLVILK
jgi:hypothetical protein